MDEKDYIELQNLLVKLRIAALKEISNPNIPPKSRDADMKIIRYVDWLRNNTILQIYGGTDMNDKEFVEKVCSRCENNHNEDCNIVKRMDGNSDCANKIIKEEENQNVSNE